MKKIILLFTIILGGYGFSQAQFSVQRVVLEKFTGTWCGYCADGAYRVEQLEAVNPNVMVIAWHGGDINEPMMNPDGAEVINYYATGFPQGMINRDGGLYSRTQWVGACNTASQGAGVITVSIDSLTYDPLSREIFVRVSGQFTGPESGDLRFNVVVTERNVSGGSAYSQTNYDNTTAGHPYQGAGSPIAGFVHQNVGRAALGGPWGTSGVIPASVNFGNAFTHDYTYTLPDSYDENEINLIALVSKYGATANDRKILNGEEAALPLAVGTPEGLHSKSNLMDIAPNPISDFTQIAFSLVKSGAVRLEILDVQGRVVDVVAEGYMAKGIHTQVWDGADAQGAPVENGVYLARLVTETGQSVTRRLMVAH